MNKYFDINDIVANIINKYPKALDVLVNNGFSQLSNPVLRATMAKTIKLSDALKMKGLNAEIMEAKIVEAIEGDLFVVDSSLNSKKKSMEADVIIEGVLPCPIKIPLMEDFESFIGKTKTNIDYTVDYDLQSANLGVDSIREKLEKGNIDELPDVMMSAGFELFFDKNIMSKYLENGDFYTPMSDINKDFENEHLSLRDPKGRYAITSVVPAIFMVNHDELNGRKGPQTWEDILSDDFENSVSLPLKDLDLFNAVVLHIWKFFGEDGVKKLSKNFMKSLHPSQMVKSNTAASGGVQIGLGKQTAEESKAPAVSIAPYFFTQMLKEGGNIKAVWPKDGAIISPIFLIAKKSKEDKVKPFLDYFMSDEVSGIMSAGGKFPSLNPNIDNKIDGSTFKWVGWDYIENNDIADIIHRCEKIFGLK